MRIAVVAFDTDDVMHARPARLGLRVPEEDGVASAVAVYEGLAP
jgi:hypothetical protein